MSNPINTVEQEITQPVEARAGMAGVASPEAAAPAAAPARLNQALSQAFGDVVQSGPSDQLRGYANEAMGRTKLAVGLALRSPELALAGIAQGALGAMQRYVGEAKMAAADPQARAGEEDDATP
jgi:uncharacterized protein YjbJ (UPF0337 family)